MDDPLIVSRGRVYTLGDLDLSEHQEQLIEIAVETTYECQRSQWLSFADHQQAVTRGLLLGMGKLKAAATPEAVAEVADRMALVFGGANAWFVH